MRSNHHENTGQISMVDEINWNILLYSMALPYLSIGCTLMHIQFLSIYNCGSSRDCNHYRIPYYIGDNNKLEPLWHILGIFCAPANNIISKVGSSSTISIFYFPFYSWKGRMILDLELFILIFPKSEWTNEDSLAIRAKLGDDVAMLICQIYKSDSK